MAATLDARALSKLRWRCRRGLLENDLFIERFFERHAATLTEPQADGLRALMDLSDPELLDLLLGRSEPDGGWANDDVLQVLRLMRAPRDAGPASTAANDPHPAPQGKP